MYINIYTDNIYPLIYLLNINVNQNATVLLLIFYCDDASSIKYKIIKPYFTEKRENTMIIKA